MIIVKVDLKSAISSSRNKVLGEMIICNDGTGTNARGNYVARFYSGGKMRRLIKEVYIKSHARKQLSIWILVHKALEEAGYFS